VRLLQPALRLGRHQHRRRRPLLGPAEAGGVEAVVDPGQRALPGVGVDRGQLPVGAAAPGAVEGDVGQLRQPQQRRQVEVGFLLPAARPDQLEGLGQAPQPVAGGERDAVRDAVDQLIGVERPLRPLLEAEQGDDAVDVDRQQRPRGSGVYQR